MSRTDGWEDRLTALVQDRLTMPFIWGQNDCCLWPADVVKTLKGIDVAEDVRGTYESARGATRVLALVGGLPTALARTGTPIAPLCAGVGDVGLVTAGGEMEVGGVCMGDHWLVVAKNGLAQVPLSAAQQAWRVG
jgi:hypothetical protein